MSISKYVQLIQQQRREQQRQETYQPELAAKLGTKVGTTTTSGIDAQRNLTQFLKNTNRINTTQAENYKKIQETQIAIVQEEYNKVLQNRDQYHPAFFSSYSQNVGRYLKEAGKNLEKINKSIERGKNVNISYDKQIKALEKASLQPRLKKKISYKTSPTKAQREAAKAKQAGPPKELRSQLVTRKSALNRPPILYENVIQAFYDKSNNPSESEMNEALQKYGLVGAKQKFKPNSPAEALNRLIYASLETVGGGIREATLGFSGSLGVENRSGGVYLQVVGGLATPTALDYAAGYTLSKLAIRKNGRRIIQKINDYFYPEKMWANPQMAAKAAKAWESTGIIGRPTTNEVRNAARVIKSLDLDSAKPWVSPGEFNTLKRIKDLAEKNKIDELTTLLNAAPEKNLRYADLVPKSNWNVYRLTVKKLTSELKPRKYIPLDEILTPNEYKLYQKTFKDTGIDWDVARYYNKEKLKELTELKLKILKATPESGGMAVPDYVFADRMVRELGWDADEYFDMLKKYKIDPDLAVSIFFNMAPKDREKMLKELGYSIPKPIPGITTKPISQMSQEEINDLARKLDIKPSELTAPLPYIGETPEELTKQQEQQKTAMLFPQQPIPTPEPPPPEEPSPPETPPIVLTPKEKEERKTIPLRIYNGAKQMWRVTQDNQTQTIEARGVIDALSKARRGRIAKKPSKLITVELVKV